MRFRRTVPPVAASLGAGELLHGLAGLFSGSRLLRRREAEMKEYFGVRHVYLLSSGKAALVLILQAMQSLRPRRRRVLIPAYTCYSVPAAILKAGLEVAPCDINPDTLDFDRACLERTAGADTLCVLPTHLFGLPAEVEGLHAWCREREIFVVEDAAQAMGGRAGGRFLGTAGDAGFFSLGRGKNLTCGSGGIALVRDEDLAEAMASRYASLPGASRSTELAHLLSLLLMRLFIGPRWYWLPAGLPFLKLGVTIFEPEFPVSRLSRSGAGALHGWRRRLQGDNAVRAQQATFYLRRLPKTGGRPEGIPYLRLPVLLRDRAERDAVHGELKDRGVSTMYPAPIHQIEEIRHLAACEPCPGAERVAARLLTLPTHRLVSAGDRRWIVEGITASLAGEAGHGPCPASRRRASSTVSLA